MLLLWRTHWASLKLSWKPSACLSHFTCACAFVSEFLLRYHLLIRLSHLLGHLSVKQAACGSLCLKLPVCSAVCLSSYQLPVQLFIGFVIYLSSCLSLKLTVSLAILPDLGKMLRVPSAGAKCTPLYTRTSPTLVAAPTSLSTSQRLIQHFTTLCCPAGAKHTPLRMCASPTLAAAPTPLRASQQRWQKLPVCPSICQATSYLSSCLSVKLSICEAVCLRSEFVALAILPDLAKVLHVPSAGAKCSPLHTRASRPW